MQDKKRVITVFEKLDETLREQLKLVYPDGFSQNLIKFKNKEGEMVSALRFETDEIVYLVKMSVNKAEQIISDDMDFNEDGNLKKKVREDYEEKYSDLDYIYPEDEEPDKEDSSYDDDDEDDY